MRQAEELTEKSLERMDDCEEMEKSLYLREKNVEAREINYRSFVKSK